MNFQRLGGAGGGVGVGGGGGVGSPPKFENCPVNKREHKLCHFARFGTHAKFSLPKKKMMFHFESQISKFSGQCARTSSFLLKMRSCFL